MTDWDGDYYDDGLGRRKCQGCEAPVIGRAVCHRCLIIMRNFSRLLATAPEPEHEPEMKRRIKLGGPV